MPQFTFWKYTKLGLNSFDYLATGATLFRELFSFNGLKNGEKKCPNGMCSKLFTFELENGKAMGYETG
jgi:hypothetical protein